MTSHVSERGLILAPMGRDARVAASMLSEAQIECGVCESLVELVDGLERGAGFAVVTEEALHTADLHPLAAWIGAQPEWSDFPFIVLTLRGGLERNPMAIRLLRTLGNVTFLERPFHPTTLMSLAQAAIRGRRRQYEARARLRSLAQLNETLEARVDAAVAERRQAQKMEAVGQLTGGVAHDFNNLLMVFSTGLFLLNQPMEAAQRQRVVDGMRRALERGTALTRQLLAFSRRRPLAPKSVSLESQLLGMQEILQRSLRGDVEVQMSFDEGLWPVDVDPGELELAVLNLCLNARDAMPDGGTIRITGRNLPAAAAGGSDTVILSVADTGVGMSQDVASRAFEPFFTTKEVGRGSGLGLAQVYGFANQSNGRVSIESAVGRGTVVTLEIPRSERGVAADDEQQASDGAIPGHVLARRTHSRAVVLLVEDDLDVAVVTREMLINIGYAVTHVKTVRAALDILAEGLKVDVVFSDVMLPGGMSGVELAREIRRRRPGLPVVLTTGYVEAARSAMAEGFEVLIKPCQVDDLARVLEAHVSSRSVNSG